MTWFRRLMGSPRARRGVAASAVVVAVGGLVLVGSPGSRTVLAHASSTGNNSLEFSAEGARGTLSLSHQLTQAGSDERVFAELRLTADPPMAAASGRAPLSLAIVFDTSGSMAGEKLETSKRSVRTLLEGMRDDDEVAFVRYDSGASLVQPLARIGDVREGLLQRVSALEAGGGTHIPPALSHGLREVEKARGARVRRVVLVSDGLDSTRNEAESLARNATEDRVTVSALGIGLDFDEGYMAGVASAGRGNFGYVRDTPALTQFLQRELNETAATVVTLARARFTLPKGVRLVRAVGADAKTVGDEVDLLMGSLFAGDERRVLVEFSVDAEHGQKLDLGSTVSWQTVAGSNALATLPKLQLQGERDRRLVQDGRDPGVLAAAASAFASLRQLEAAAAYSRGDTQAADGLLAENEAALTIAESFAPKAAAPALMRQRKEVQKARSAFRAAKPGSVEARDASKASVEANTKNLGRSSF